jgi:hypothetical protein
MLLKNLKINKKNMFNIPVKIKRIRNKKKKSQE